MNFFRPTLRNEICGNNNKLKNITHSSSLSWGCLNHDVAIILLCSAGLVSLEQELSHLTECCFCMHHPCAPKAFDATKHPHADASEAENVHYCPNRSKRIL
jgi:hypothetical protein